METISISPKFQVVIPKAIHEALGLVSGQKMQVLRYGDRVELTPLRPLAQSRGFLATARQFKATLWSRNADFEGLAGVHYRAGQRPV